MSHAHHVLKIPPFRALTSAEQEQLEALCPSFGIHFQRLGNQLVSLQVADCRGVRTSNIPEHILHCRLLCELCEKVVPWVYFNSEEHCAESLFKLGPSRIHRLLALYLESQEQSKARQARSARGLA